MSKKDQYLAACLREGGKIVGLLGINGMDDEKQLDLGHVFPSTYQDNDHDKEALRTLIQHCFDMRGALSIVTRNAADHAQQLAPLLSLGFTNRNPENSGELTISREVARSLPSPLTDAFDRSYFDSLVHKSVGCTMP